MLMNILVFNGSPKGKNSLSLQTVFYLQNLFTDDDFEIMHVGQKIKSFEKDFSLVADKVEWADLIFFVYPVYTFLVPSQLVRFVELLKIHNIDFREKVATQLSTSKHFYDTTAHQWICDICADLEMKYIRGLSADMDDLLFPKGQNEAFSFWKQVHFDIENELYSPVYKPEAKSKTKKMKSIVLKEMPKKEDFTVALVTDLSNDTGQLVNMINAFINCFQYTVKLVDIGTYPFSGGCLGCFRCAIDEKCIYKDGFDSYLRDEIQSMDATIYAFAIKDHAMGSRFKMYDDRNFCNGHRPVTIGAPTGYLISGNLSIEENLQTLIEARSQVGENYLAGIVTDEKDPEGEISDLAVRLAYALENKLLFPQNFYGLGGRRIFRDLIYLMQGMMAADHAFYKKHKLYDFPQKQWKTRLRMCAVGILIRNKKIMNKLAPRLNEFIIAPYKKVVDGAKNKI